MGKTIAKILYFLGGLLFIILFIRFAWLKEYMGQQFPTYITPLVMIVGAFVLLGFYLVGCYIFDGDKRG